MKSFCVLFAVVSCVHGLAFVCDFGDFGSKTIGVHYGCNVTSIIAGDDIDVLEIVTGDHVRGKSNSDVLSLTVQNQQILNSIPRDIEKFFPGLIKMKWTFGTLTSVSAEDLEPFFNLLVFEISNNNLASLDGDLFSNNPSIRWINFQNNFIEQIDDELLTDLNSLSHVNLRGNACIDMLASTPKEIQNLTAQFPLKCPIPDTSELPDCSTGCLLKIESVVDEFSSETDQLWFELLKLQENENKRNEDIPSLREEIVEQNEKLNRLFHEISRQNKQLSEQNQQILRQDENILFLNEEISENKHKIAELEKRMRTFFKR